MAPLNVVLDKNRARVNNFLEELTHVDNLEEHLKLDEYIVLGKTNEAVINISLNEMYFIHQLLKEHIDTIIPKEEWQRDTLFKILHGLGDAPAQISRKDNANVDLKLDNSICASIKDTQTPEQLFSEAKYLLYTVVKALPVNEKKFDLKSQLEVATSVASKSTSSPKLKENTARLRELIQIMIKSGQVREDDGFSSLIKEAVQEMANSEMRLRKTEEDLKRLQTVLQNILEHNKFLQDQFGAYKEYLENVRQSCGSVSVKKTKKSTEPPTPPTPTQKKRNTKSGCQTTQENQCQIFSSTT